MVGIFLTIDEPVLTLHNHPVSLSIFRTCVVASPQLHIGLQGEFCGYVTYMTKGLCSLGKGFEMRRASCIIWEKPMKSVESLQGEEKGGEPDLES